MANQELVAYLRAHWKRYGPDTLRRKLIEEGVAETEVDAAMAEAYPKVRINTFKPQIMLAAAAAILIAAIWFMNSERGTEEKTVLGPPSKQIRVQDNLNDVHQEFQGHYGYGIRLPLGYNALSDFKDPEKTIEEVYLFPKGTDLNNLRDEGLYGPLGILRLEVRPRRISAGRAGVAAIRGQVAASLQQNRTPYSIRETLVSGLQAIIVNVQGPNPQARAYVIGTGVIYTLIAGSENQLFTATLSGLEEHAPKERPANP